MTTIVDALTDATSALKDATAKVLAFMGVLQTQADGSRQAATTVINNFLTKPLSAFYWVDPATGDDDNDGSDPSKKKRSLDSTIDSIPSALQNVVIFLYGDDTIKRFHGLSCSIVIFGVQDANNPSGRAAARRTITFLGLATNSPDVNGQTFSAGINFGGSYTLFTDSIDWTLVDVPAGLNIRSHINTGGSLFVSMNAFNLKASANASALFGVLSGRLTAALTPVFGIGGAGHLFSGVAAGANPNQTTWYYDTNITSA